VQTAAAGHFVNTASRRTGVMIVEAMPDIHTGYRKAATEKLVNV
jgi:hypothetical protein